jgi:putative copper resistance protein D
VRALGDLAAATTLGVLVLAAVALPVSTPGPRSAPRAFAPALLLAAAAAAVWTLATVALTVLTYADISGQLLSDPLFGQGLWQFVTSSEPGRGLAVTALVAATVSVLAVGARSLTAAALLALLSAVALVPPALAGHAAGPSTHETAVTSLGLHLAGVSLWVGGLLGLVLLRGHLGERLSPSAARYSTLAGWAFAAVALSGLLNAWVRLPGVDALGTDYGAILVVKTAALAVLGGAGWLHRRRTLTELAAGRPHAFARLAGVELAVMTVALGLSAALSRTAPPVPDTPVGARTPAEALTGNPLPPPPTAASWFTQWQPDLLWVLLVLVAAGLYVAGVRRLRARGDRWPVLRTVGWLAGLTVLLWVTSGGPAVYGRILFSSHMVGHMTLSMLVPLLLVAGAPTTLALRSIRPRRDGTRGPREWMLVALESRYLRVLAHPVVAAVIFTGSLIAFYYSPLFGLALRTHVGHELMYAHFLLAGYLFAWVLVGVDPGPHRPSPPLRLLVLLATMAFHAFFGVALISGTAVLQPEWFAGLGRTWGAGLLEDQRTGGGIAWGIGEVPTLVLALVIAVQWYRSDTRDARRQDRRADRDGDADLAAYNAMLAGMAERDRADDRTS